jgi:hypothetical protein
LEQVPENNLIPRNPGIIVEVGFSLRRLVGVFVSWGDLQLLRGLGISAIEEPNKAGTTDRRQNLRAPAGVIVSS